MDISRLSPEHQAFIKRQSKTSDNYRKPKKEKPVKYDNAFDSGLEIQYADEAEAYKKIGRIDSWMYHPIRVRLAHGCNYTPDFGLRMLGEFVLIETKGSWKAKGARDSRTRLQIAQQMFPWWIWVDVTKDKHGFVYKVIGPLGEPATSIGFAQVEASILRLQNIVQPRLATELEPNSSRHQGWTVEPSLALMNAADEAGR
jgi:hypothetical protein